MRRWVTDRRFTGAGERTIAGSTTSVLLPPPSMLGRGGKPERVPPT
jgi:hypothetical protein